MERKINSDINIEWKASLIAWDISPDNPAISLRVNELIQKTYDMGGTLVLKISPDRLLGNSESKRAIQLNDLKELFRYEDGNFVTRLSPKKNGRVKLFAMDDYLVLADNRFGEMVPTAFFRSREIQSIEVE